MGKNIFVTKGAINSTADSTKAYMRDIKRVKMIDKEKEQKLAERIQAGDRQALNELVAAKFEVCSTSSTELSLSLIHI